MSDNNRILTAGAVAAAGLMIAGGAAAAQAATSTAPAATGYGSTPGYGAPPGYGDGRGRGGHEHTTVTGDEATRVKEAVKAKDSAVTVEQVLKDPDGSYDVIGTKAGQRVMVEVSKDLKTVEVHTGGRGGPGGRGGKGLRGGNHTAASASETTQVKAAVKAKDSTITVEQVMKDEDGSFDAMGTKAGQRVMAEVSKDLKTVDVRTGGRGGHGRHAGQPGQTPAPSTSGAASPAGYAV